MSCSCAERQVEAPAVGSERAGVRAASELPPPRPPPVGMCFCSATCTADTEAPQAGRRSLWACPVRQCLRRILPCCVAHRQRGTLDQVRLVQRHAKSVRGVADPSRRRTPGSGDSLVSLAIPSGCQRARPCTSTSRAGGNPDASRGPTRRCRLILAVRAGAVRHSVYEWPRPVKNRTRVERLTTVWRDTSCIRTCLNPPEPRLPRTCPKPSILRRHDVRNVLASSILIARGGVNEKLGESRSSHAAIRLPSCARIRCAKKTPAGSEPGGRRQKVGRGASCQAPASPAPPGAARQGAFA